MLLDYKINYILSKETEILNAVYTRLITKLGIDGEAETRYTTTIEILLSLFKTSILEYNLKLALYKKLMHLLRYFGLIYRTPDLTDSDNPILYWGAGNVGLSLAQLSEYPQHFNIISDSGQSKRE